MEDMKQVETRALAIPDQAREIAVTDEASLRGASTFLSGVKALRKEISDTFDPMIQKAHQIHKEALQQKKRFEEPLKEGEKIVKELVADYMAEQDRIRMEAEEKQRRELAEIERKKREEEERALAEAQKLEEEGKADEAAEVLEKAETTVEEPAAPATVIPQKPIPTHGVSARKIWKWKIVDASLIPAQYLVPDEKLIGKLLRASDFELKIPGVEAYQEMSVAARS